MLCLTLSGKCMKDHLESLPFGQAKKMKKGGLVDNLRRKNRDID